MTRGVDSVARVLEGTGEYRVPLRLRPFVGCVADAAGQRIDDTRAARWGRLTVQSPSA